MNPIYDERGLIQVPDHLGDKTGASHYTMNRPMTDDDIRLMQLKRAQYKHAISLRNNPDLDRLEKSINTLSDFRNIVSDKYKYKVDSKLNDLKNIRSRLDAATEFMPRSKNNRRWYTKDDVTWLDQSIDKLRNAQHKYKFRNNPISRKIDYLDKVRLRSSRLEPDGRRMLNPIRRNDDRRRFINIKKLLVDEENNWKHMR